MLGQQGAELPTLTTPDFERSFCDAIGQFLASISTGGWIINYFNLSFDVTRLARHMSRLLSQYTHALPNKHERGHDEWIDAAVNTSRSALHNVRDYQWPIAAYPPSHLKTTPVM